MQKEKNEKHMNISHVDPTPRQSLEIVKSGGFESGGNNNVGLSGYNQNDNQNDKNNRNNNRNNKLYDDDNNGIDASSQFGRVAHTTEAQSNVQSGQNNNFVPQNSNKFPRNANKKINFTIPFQQQQQQPQPRSIIESNKIAFTSAANPKNYFQNNHNTPFFPQTNSFLPQNNPHFPQSSNPIFPLNHQNPQNVQSNRQTQPTYSNNPYPIPHHYNQLPQQHPFQPHPFQPQSSLFSAVPQIPTLPQEPLPQETLPPPDTTQPLISNPDSITQQSLSFKAPFYDSILAVSAWKPKYPTLIPKMIKTLPIRSKLPDPFSEQDEYHSTPYLIQMLLVLRAQISQCHGYLNAISPLSTYVTKLTSTNDDVPTINTAMIHKLPHYVFEEACDYLQMLFLKVYMTLCLSDNVTDGELTEQFVLQYPRPTKHEFNDYLGHVVKTTLTKPFDCGGKIHPLTPLELTARMGHISAMTLDKCVYRVFRYPVLPNPKQESIDFILRIAPNNPHGFTRKQILDVERMPTNPEKRNKVRKTLEERLLLKVKDKPHIQDSMIAWLKIRLPESLTTTRVNTPDVDVNSLHYHFGGADRFGNTVLAKPECGDDNNNLMKIRGKMYDFNRLEESDVRTAWKDGDICLTRGMKAKTVTKRSVIWYFQSIRESYKRYYKQVNVIYPFDVHKLWELTHFEPFGEIHDEHENCFRQEMTANGVTTGFDKGCVRVQHDGRKNWREYGEEGDNGEDGEDGGNGDSFEEDIIGESDVLNVQNVNLDDEKNVNLDDEKNTNLDEKNNVDNLSDTPPLLSDSISKRPLLPTLISSIKKMCGPEAVFNQLRKEIDQNKINLNSQINFGNNDFKKNNLQAPPRNTSNPFYTSNTLDNIGHDEKNNKKENDKNNDKNNEHFDKSRGRNAEQRRGQPKSGDNHLVLL